MSPKPADRRFARDLGPEREHHERHVVGEDPDDELGAVGDRRGEADAKKRGDGAEGAHAGGSLRRVATEEIGDDLLERRVLHSQVFDRQLGERAPHELANRRRLDLKDRAVVVERHDPPAERIQPLTRDGAREAEGDPLVRANIAHERVEGAVVGEPPAVDDDDARAERGDVVHVVAREEDRRAEALVVRADEAAHRRLHRHVEPDRRLVEEEHLRAVEERGGELALHPLAERELAGGLAEERRDREELDELVQRSPVLFARDVVDRAIELERLRRRQVPEELLLLPRHEHDRAQEARSAGGEG